MTDHFVNTKNTQYRGDETYKKVIEDIKNDKVCPFCRSELDKYHKKPILRENTHWLVTENMYPYKGAKKHFLFIHKQHITSPEEMTPEAQHELFALIAWTKKEYTIPGGTFFMRFGDTRYTGASVSHLHAQLVTSDPSKDGYSPILTRIG